jgi:hypothetical protein
MTLLPASDRRSRAGDCAWTYKKHSLVHRTMPILRNENANRVLPWLRQRIDLPPDNRPPGTPMSKHDVILTTATPFLMVLIILSGAGAVLYSHPLVATAQMDETETRTSTQKHFDMCHILNTDLTARPLSARQAEQIKSLNDCFDDDRDDPLYGQWVAEFRR